MQEKTNSQHLLRTDLSKRIYGLDILRAIAILCVLIGHGLEFLPEWATKYEADIYKLTAHGVTMFFVLSGFLIGGILIKTFHEPDFSTKSVGKFWVSRWMRTLPPYYFTLILLLVVMYAFDLPYWPGHLTKMQIARFFLFLQNFKYPILPFFVESWSLPIEEWFYLLTPIALFILYKFVKLGIKKSFVIMILFIIISILVLRIYRYVNNIPYENQVVTRTDSLMFGVLGAFIMFYYSKSWVKYKNILFYIGIILLAGTFVIDLFFYEIGSYEFLAKVLGMTFIPALFLLMLPYLSELKTRKGIMFRFFTFISLISYSLYLIHHTMTKYIIVHNGIAKHFGTGSVVNGLLYWCISIALATLMYLIIEKPCMDIRTKIKFLKK